MHEFLLFGVLECLVLDNAWLAVNSEFTKVINDPFAVAADVVRRFIASGSLKWFGGDS